MVHGGGGREMQRALESQAQQQAAGGGESYQGGEGPGRLKKIILFQPFIDQNRTQNNVQVSHSMFILTIPQPFFFLQLKD